MNKKLPLTLIAELTYRCPLRCPYCSNPTNYGKSNYRQELTTEYWLEAIRQAASLGMGATRFYRWRTSFKARS